MAKIGTIPANGELTLSIQNMPEKLVLGSSAEGNPLSYVAVSVSGREFQVINGKNLIAAFSKINNAPRNTGALSVMFPIALGKLNNKETELTLRNDEAEPVEVFGYGTQRSGILYRSGTQTINDGSSAEYSGFRALIFDPEHVTQAEVIFQSGYKELMTVPELVALMAKTNISVEADGLISGMIVLQNNLSNVFKRVTLYSNGGATTVLVVKTAVLDS